MDQAHAARITHHAKSRTLRGAPHPLTPRPKWMVPPRPATRCPVLRSCYSIHGSWCSVLGAPFLVLGAWFSVRGSSPVKSRTMVGLGTTRPTTDCPMLGAWCLVLGACPAKSRTLRGVAQPMAPHHRRRPPRSYARCSVLGAWCSVL